MTLADGCTQISIGRLRAPVAPSTLAGNTCSLHAKGTCSFRFQAQARPQGSISNPLGTLLVAASDLPDSSEGHRYANAT
jgi:hypothetical protein